MKLKIRPRRPQQERQQSNRSDKQNTDNTTLDKEGWSNNEED